MTRFAPPSPLATVGQPITPTSPALQFNGDGPPGSCRPGDDYCNNEILNQLATCLIRSDCADITRGLRGRGKLPSGLVLASGQSSDEGFKTGTEERTPCTKNPNDRGCIPGPGPENPNRESLTVNQDRSEATRPEPPDPDVERAGRRQVCELIVGGICGTVTGDNPAFFFPCAATGSTVCGVLFPDTQPIPPARR